MKTHATTILAFLMAAASPIASAAAEGEELHTYYTVVPGRFALIGQLPDGGSPYKGEAEITYADGRLHLVKRVDGKPITAEGTVERADPGEADVLRFRWPGHEETCLVRLDLDNYSRLSCYWTVNGSKHRKPGLEAYFPTEAWP